GALVGRASLVDGRALGDDLAALEDHEVVLDVRAVLEFRQDDAGGLAEVLAVDRTPVGGAVATEVSAQKAAVDDTDREDRQLAADEARHGRVFNGSLLLR